MLIPEQENIVRSNMSRILCSAIHVDNGQEYVHQPKNIKTGMVICGRRHHNIIPTIQLMFNDDIIKDLKLERKIVQGFLTSDDLFLNREEAYKVAKHANQLEKTLIGSVLISEDLY